MTYQLYPRDIGQPPLLLTAAECRVQCRIDHDDEDDLLLGFAAAAQGWVEAFTGRLLTRRLMQADADCWGVWRIWAAPVSVASISYIDADGAPQILDPASVIVRERAGVTEVYPASGVTMPPRGSDTRVTVAVTAGYAPGACPADLRVACLLLVGHYYRNREAVVTGVAANELPLAVESLCIRHRLAVA